ncbi:MAG TPA: DUF2007 domain-containing protein [Tissierellaceae bacterium]|nr:DUF2007 domain-containing protein [Tissierellaceae bacterium]
MSKDNDNKQDREKEVELVVLKFINTEYELNLTKAVLEDNEIPYVIKDQGMGGYMRIIGGRSSMYKTEILVEESTYPKAKAILDEVFSETVED